MTASETFIVNDPDRFQAAILQFLKPKFPRAAAAFEGEATGAADLPLEVSELLQKKWFATTALEIKIRRLEQQIDLYRTRADKLKTLFFPSHKTQDGATPCVPNERLCVFSHFGCAELVAFPKDLVCFIGADSHNPNAKVCEVTRHGPAHRGSIRLSRPASAIAMSPCDNWLVVVDIGGTISKVSLTDLEAPAVTIGKLPDRGAAAVYSCPPEVDFDAGDFLVVIVTQDSHLQVWSAAKRVCTKSVAAGSAKLSVKSHCLLSDAKHNTWLLLGMSDGSICQWKVAGEQESMAIEKLKTKHERSAEVVCARSGPTPLYASAGRDHLIRIVDHQTDACQLELRGHADWVTALAFHPTEPILVSAADDRSVRVWHIETGSCLTVIDNAHCSLATAMKFDSSGETLYTFAVNMGLIVWSTEAIASAISHGGLAPMTSRRGNTDQFAVFDFETGTLKHAVPPPILPPQSLTEYKLGRSILPADHPLRHVGDPPTDTGDAQEDPPARKGSGDSRAQKNARDSKTITTPVKPGRVGSAAKEEKGRPTPRSPEVPLLPATAARDTPEPRSAVDLRERHPTTPGKRVPATARPRPPQILTRPLARLMTDSPAEPSAAHLRGSMESDSDEDSLADLIAPVAVPQKLTEPTSQVVAHSSAEESETDVLVMRKTVRHQASSPLKPSSTLTSVLKPGQPKPAAEPSGKTSSNRVVAHRPDEPPTRGVSPTGAARAGAGRPNLPSHEAKVLETNPLSRTATAGTAATSAASTPVTSPPGGGPSATVQGISRSKKAAGGGPRLPVPAVPSTAIKNLARAPSGGLHLQATFKGFGGRATSPPQDGAAAPAATSVSAAPAASTGPRRPSVTVPAIPSVPADRSTRVSPTPAAGLTAVRNERSVSGTSTVQSDSRQAPGFMAALKGTAKGTASRAATAQHKGPVTRR